MDSNLRALENDMGGRIVYRNGHAVMTYDNQPEPYVVNHQPSAQQPNIDYGAYHSQQANTKSILEKYHSDKNIPGTDAYNVEMMTRDAEEWKRIRQPHHLAKDADLFMQNQKSARDMARQFETNIPKSTSAPMTNEQLAAAQQEMAYQMFPHLRPKPTRTVEQMEAIDRPIIPINPIGTAFKIATSSNPELKIAKEVGKAAASQIHGVYEKAYEVGKGKDKVMDSVVFPK